MAERIATVLRSLITARGIGPVAPSFASWLAVLS